MPIQFFDETTFNPLPPGVNVTIYGTWNTPTAANIIGTDLLNYGGIASISLQPNGQYTAVFTGTQAPTVTCQFTAAPAQVQSPINSLNGSIGGYSLPPLDAVVYVTSYKSPTLSPAGWAQAQTELLPSGWFGDIVVNQSGNAYNLLLGLAGGIGTIDQQLQLVLAALRVQTAQGTQIDSWAYDFFGTLFLRYPNESDASWYSRILAIFATAKTTCTGLAAIITLFLPAIFTTFTGTSPLLAEDVSGSEDGVGGGGEDIVPTPPIPSQYLLAEDVAGGEDLIGTEDGGPQTIQSPNVIVFDLQTDPIRSNILNSQTAGTIQPGRFCVYLTFPGYADALMHVVQPITPSLSALVNCWKAAGMLPVYAANA